MCKGFLTVLSAVLLPLYSIANIPYYVRDSPIRFKVEPQDQTKVHYEILSSSNITFNCEFSVEPVVSGWYPKIYWYHNGSIVQESEGIHVQSNHWNWTQLSTVYPGSYQCVVNDGYFTTVSRKAWFFLYGTVEDPPEVMAVSSNYSIGETVVLKCRPNIPEPTMIWKKNNKIIDIHPPKFIPLKSGDLLLYDAEVSDSGHYACLAVSQYYSNPDKLAMVAIFSLSVIPSKVYHQMEFILLPESQFIYQNKDVNLSCVARGNNLTYIWLRDSKPLQGRMFGNSVININPLLDGTYTCVVSDEQKSISATATATMFKKRECSDQSVDYFSNGMTNEPLTLMCYAPFHSLDIEWYHNGKKLNNTKSTLTIPKEINVTDVIGIYQCFVQDKNFTAIPYHSQQMSSYRLIMKNKPNPPGKLEYSECVCGMPCNLTWERAENKVVFGTQFVAVKSSDGTCSSETPLDFFLERLPQVPALSKCCGRVALYVISTSNHKNASPFNFLWSTPGNQTRLIDVCGDKCRMDLNGNFTCSVDELTKSNFECDFHWSYDPSDGPIQSVYDSSDLLLRCNDAYEKDLHSKQLHARFSDVPCDVECFLSVNDTGWSGVAGKFITFTRSLSVKINSSKPQRAPELMNITRVNCSQFLLELKVPKPSCGALTHFNVNIDESDQLKLPIDEALDYDGLVTLSVTSSNPANFSVSAINDGGESEISNTLSVPSLSREEVNRCGTVSCQRNVDNCGSRKISCSLNFTSFELSRISSVHYTVFDCSNYHLVSFVRAKCQLDIDCEKVLSSNLSRPYETNMQPVYCDSHTNRIKCLVFQITFGEMSLFFNETVDASTCDNNDYWEYCKQDSQDSNSQSATIPTASSDNGTNGAIIPMSVVSGIIALVLIVLLIFLVFYCRSRRKTDAEFRESIRSLSASHDRNNSCTMDGPELEDDVFQSVHPDNTTEIASHHKVQNWLVGSSDPKDGEDDSDSISDRDDVPLLSPGNLNEPVPFSPVCVSSVTRATRKDYIEMHQAPKSGQRSGYTKPSIDLTPSSQQTGNFWDESQTSSPLTPSRVIGGYVEAQFTDTQEPTRQELKEFCDHSLDSPVIPSTSDHKPLHSPVIPSTSDHKPESSYQPIGEAMPTSVDEFLAVPQGQDDLCPPQGTQAPLGHYTLHPPHGTQALQGQDDLHPPQGTQAPHGHYTLHPPQGTQAPHGHDDLHPPQGTQALQGQDDLHPPQGTQAPQGQDDLHPPQGTQAPHGQDDLHLPQGTQIPQGHYTLHPPQGIQTPQGHGDLHHPQGTQSPWGHGDLHPPQGTQAGQGQDDLRPPQGTQAPQGQDDLHLPQGTQAPHGHYTLHPPQGTQATQVQDDLYSPQSTQAPWIPPSFYLQK